MSKRLPDELFRSASAPESTDVRREEPVVQSRPRPAFRAREVKEVAPTMVVAGVVGALLLGFSIGKLVAFQSGLPSPDAPTRSAAPTYETPSVNVTLAPWSNGVRPVTILDADGRCQDSISVNPASNLLDSDPTSVWSCRGDGAGEVIDFTLEPGEVVVGVRLVNGNTISPERYLAERRILSVKWTFSDGSWMLQGLAANDPTPQEIRFPATTIAGEISMTVLAATVPGETDITKDAVSVSFVEFLGADD